MDFPDFAGGVSPSRQAIDRRMAQLDVEPLDRAGRTIRVGIVVGLVFLAAFALYGLLAPISSAAVADGEVSVAGDKLVVQPEATGVITRVLVAEGQPVRKGQALVNLDPLRSNAQLAQAESNHAMLLASEARLLAERDGASSIAFPEELTRRTRNPEIAAILTSERELFRRHASMQAADRAATGATLASTRAQQVATQRAQASIEDELGSYRELYAQGFARKTTVRSLERTAARLEADRATGTGAIQQAVLQRGRVVDAQFNDIVTQLVQVRQQLAQAGPALAIARHDAGETIIRSPGDGRVSGVADLGPGMLIGGGKTLMEVVPANGRLWIDAKIKPADVDDVRVGQPATLRFATVNPHGRTAFQGHVVALSPDRVGAGEGAYYRALVALDDVAAARKEGLTLQPGIPVSVNIKTKDRTLFGYLFSPIIDAISRAMREE
jgi:HlyD family type I secretion membrane fusion protein